MQTVLLHTHQIAIALFLLSFLFKVIMLLADKKEPLAKYRKKTLMAENLLALLFLGTGIYMWANIGFGLLGGWFHLKLTLVVIAIPIGIIGIKKENKWLGSLAMLIFLYILGIALTKQPLLFF